MMGGFSEYVKVDNAKEGYNIYKLDPSIDLEAAAIIEPLCVGTHGATCTHPKQHDHVVILGAGTIGLCAAASLIARGLENVVVVDQDNYRLDKAKEIGAKTINTKEVDLVDQLMEYFGPVQSDAHLNPVDLEPDLIQEIMNFAKEANINLGGVNPDIDLAVDCAGALPLLQQMFNLSKEKTKYVIVAVYHKDITLNSNIFIMNQPIVRGSKAYNHDTIVEVIDHITKEKTPIKTIVTKKFKQEDLPEAIKVASEANNNIKVLIDYEL